MRHTQRRAGACHELRAGLGCAVRRLDAGQVLLSLGQTMVVVCVCFDMVACMSVPRSHRRYVASTVFRTLAVPLVLVMGLRALLDAASGVWMDVAGVFVMVVVPSGAPRQGRGQLVEGQGQETRPLGPEAAAAGGPSLPAMG